MHYKSWKIIQPWEIIQPVCTWQRGKIGGKITSYYNNKVQVKLVLKKSGENIL